MLRKVVLAAAIALFVWIPGEAQYSPRPVTGVVTDKSGNTLPGVVVQLENTRSLVVRSYITQKDGRYRFNLLNDGVDYTLRARYRKWWSDRKTLSRLNSSAHPEVDFVIPID